MAYELTTSTDYIRTREVFLIQADMSEYLIEYYIHRKDYVKTTKPEHDEKLKELMICFALHLGARTTLETHAWTFHIVADEPYSLFVTGSTGEIDESGLAHGFLVGNILTDHIRHSDTNAIHTQVSSQGKTFKSFVRCDSSDIRTMVETFYEQSEQRPLRIELSQTSDTAIALAALPGFDIEWFKPVSLEEVKTDSNDKTAMRKCMFSLKCDCSPEKLLPFFRALPPEQLAELYGDEDEIKITRPRCGKRFTVNRSEVEFDV